MASTVAQVADAVLGVLKGLQYPMAVECARGYGDIDEQLEERDKAQVDVIAGARPLLELATRGAWGYQIDIHAILRQRFSAFERSQLEGRIANELIDPMVEVVEVMAEALIPQRFTALEPIDAKWFSTTIEAIYISEHLRQYGQFTGHVRTTFMVEKPIP